MHWIIIAIYGLALFFILLYSLVQLYLVIQYRRSKKQRAVQENGVLVDFPTVTIQLPIYNERYVVERLLDAVSKIDYPQDRLQIQVLDDSTDESKNIAKNKSNELLSKGMNVQYLHRLDRSGFKAGALQAALDKCTGEFIAIFDADFLPPSDFLLRMLPAFKNTTIGMVQSRWAHLNSSYSLLTELQAFGLDAHFSVEQGGRNAADHFMNFNGTAGIWRKATILDAGGWQSDTLTEDLDLSYRAQLKGWKFIFREDVEAAAELPAEMNALKNQQYRWNKGAAECMRKNLWKVLSNQSISLSTKINAVFHLMNSAVFLCVMLLAVLSIPMMLIKDAHPELSLLFNIAVIFLISLPILVFFYWTSERRKETSFLRFAIRFPSFLSVSMGLSLHNAIAVAEGYLGRKTPFVRTPKFNLKSSREDKISENIYLDRRLNPLFFLELLLALYFLFGILLSFQLGDFGLLPFHLLLFCGFIYVSVVSILHSIKLYR